jgi:hypothetical protein
MNLQRYLTPTSHISQCIILLVGRKKNIPFLGSAREENPGGGPFPETIQSRMIKVRNNAFETQEHWKDQSLKNTLK